MMSQQTAAILEGRCRWSADHCDALDWLRSLPGDSVDLVVTSPPYSGIARTYGIGFSKIGEEWVSWMAQVVTECVRICKGLVAIVCEGTTRNYRYDATPLLLAADLHRAGFNLRKPTAYFRYGIPGSGGPDWWRNDFELVLCITRPGKLPWSDNTACGHTPKWAPGGEMSNRTKDGGRVNQWGKNKGSFGHRKKDGSRNDGCARPSNALIDHAEQEGQMLIPGVEEEEEVPPSVDDYGHALDGKSYSARRANGREKSDEASPPRSRKKVITKPRDGQHSQESTEYDPPVLANPGNVIKATYDAMEVHALLEDLACNRIDQGDLLRCLAGGGAMGSPLCHENEAPFPEALVLPFVLSFCPPGGVVADPFAGSGTVLSVAVQNGRRAIGCDIRPSQVELASRRMALVTPDLFSSSAGE